MKFLRIDPVKCFRVLCGTTLIGLSLTLTCCGSKSSNTDISDSSQVYSTKIGYSKLRISLPIFVAQEKGFFVKHGLKVDLVGYDTAQPLIQALAEGNLHLAGYSAYPITLSAMIRSNRKIYLATSMLEDAQHRISYILKKRGDSRISSLPSLKGKRVGILPTTAYKAWISEILLKNGVNLNDVNIEQVAPQQEIAALKNGTIDVLFTNDPVATAALKNGTAELVDKSPAVPAYLGSPLQFGSFCIDKEWGDSHQRQMKKIEDSLNDAIAFIEKHQAEAKLCMKNYIPSQFAEQITSYPDSLYLPTNLVKDSDIEAMVENAVKSKAISKSIAVQTLILK